MRLSIFEAVFRFGRMHRNEYEESVFLLSRYLDRSNACLTRVNCKLIPTSYSDGICIHTVGPCQIYSYQYSTRKSLKKTYICQIFFYPQVVHRRYISAVVHFPARNNAKPRTVYKDMVCFVPRCLDHFEAKKIITEPLIEEVHKTGLHHQPKTKIRQFTSSVHMAPITMDTIC